MGLVRELPLQVDGFGDVDAFIDEFVGPNPDCLVSSSIAITIKLSLD